MDRIDAMRVFIAVAKEGSFTAAADRLDLSPQLVSKYISQLEQHLSGRLLNRTTRRVSLTEAGQRYLARAERVLDEIDDMESQLGESQTEAKGLLRISAPVSFATAHLAPLLNQFQTEHPGVDIDLQLNDRKVDIVDEGFDIALRIGHLKSSSLIAKRIAPIRLVMCASPDYLNTYGRPITVAELGQHQYLRYSYLDPDSNPLVSEWMRLRSKNKGSELVCNNGTVLCQAAIEGMGIVIQPTFICGDAIANGQLEVLMPEHEPEPMGLYAVYAHRQLLASKVRSFLDFIDGFYGTPPYWDRF